MSKFTTSLNTDTENRIINKKIPFIIKILL